MFNDFFNKKKVLTLEAQIEDLEKRLTPEQQDVMKLETISKGLKMQISELESAKVRTESEVHHVTAQLSELKKDVVETNETILLQSFGLYEPKFSFTKSEDYRIEIEKIRKKQKDMIKSGFAVNGATNWSINGNFKQGQKLVNDNKKLLLRAFNLECDDVIEKVKYNNFEASLKRITKASETVSNLGKMMSISLSNNYCYSKIDELKLALEYQQKKQEEKEEQKMLREQMREEVKLQREIEEARKNINKELNHYNNALKQAQLQLERSNSEDEKQLLLERIKEILDTLKDIEKKTKDLDYRESNQRAGYVYIISNIGSFGENVYKIGMTRRLDPTERVDELSDASVPFNFDIHAMIFSADAPKLENELHKAFEGKKINMINHRREFFNVPLEEIENVVKANHDKIVEFTKAPEALQYRESLLIKREKNGDSK